MSESRSTEGNLQFILPKEGSATVSLPQEDSSQVTKIIDLHIEDFMEKMKNMGNADIFTSPKLFIGDQEVVVIFHVAPNQLGVGVNVHAVDDDKHHCDLRSILLTGNVGNLTFEKREDGVRKKRENLVVKLGSMEEVKESMTTSGNHRLDLQVTLTASVIKGSINGQWIIPR